jgi:beta-galactosidase
LQVTRVESLAPGTPIEVIAGNTAFEAKAWRETIRSELEPVAGFTDGGGAWWRRGRIDYLATRPGEAFLDHVLSDAANRAGLATVSLPEGVRVRRRGGLAFAVNYAPETQATPAPIGAEYVLGGPQLPPASVAAWRDG